MDFGLTPGRHPFLRRQPSALGEGEVFTYFEESNGIGPIMLATHSVTLKHLEESPSTMMLPEPADSVINIFSAGGFEGYFAVNERLGLYLKARVSSRCTLYVMSRWYADVTAKQLATIMKSRYESRELGQSGYVGRASVVPRWLGPCTCLSCEPQWFLDGWVCPETPPTSVTLI